MPVSRTAINSTWGEGWLTNGDLAVIARELDRILQQVPDDLLKFGRVGRNMMRLARRLRWMRNFRARFHFGKSRATFEMA